MSTDAAHARLTLRVQNLDVSYRTHVTGRFAERGLRRTRRVETPVVHDVSFDAHAGEFIGLVGANGSGKSTLLKAVGGFIPHQRGTVQAVATPQLLSVSAAMKSKMSGWENITLGCLAMGIPYRDIDSVADEVADFCELGDKLSLPMGALSSGEKARLSFGIATVRTPEILMVDEALGVGDKRFRQKSVARLRDILDNAGTVFFVSHSLEEITRLCTRALWMRDGQICADGAPKAIVRQYVDWVDETGGDRASVRQALRYRSRRQERRRTRSVDVEP